MLRWTLHFGASLVRHQLQHLVGPLVHLLILLVTMTAAGDVIRWPFIRDYREHSV